MLELVLIFESDVKSMEQVITRARHVVNDVRTLATPGNRRSFASDAWALYDKVHIYAYTHMYLCIYVCFKCN